MGKKIIMILAVLALFPVSASAASAVDKSQAASEAMDKPSTGDAGSMAERDAGIKKGSGLPVPRFVALSSEKVFVRTGPALRYPIKWIYQREHMPVEIIQEFDTWRKIRDIDGDDGWVHQSLLSGERTGIAKGGEVNLAVRKDAREDGRILAYFEPGVVMHINECKGAWCEVSNDGYTGWAERKFLWGIYDSEDFD